MLLWVCRVCGCGCGDACVYECGCVRKEERTRHAWLCNNLCRVSECYWVPQVSKHSDWLRFRQCTINMLHCYQIHVLIKIKVRLKPPRGSEIKTKPKARNSRRKPRLWQSNHKFTQLMLTSDNFSRQWSGPRASDLIFCHLRTRFSANLASILGIFTSFSSTDAPAI